MTQLHRWDLWLGAALLLGATYGLGLALQPAPPKIETSDGFQFS